MRLTEKVWTALFLRQNMSGQVTVYNIPSKLELGFVRASLDLCRLIPQPNPQSLSFLGEIPGKTSGQSFDHRGRGAFYSLWMFRKDWVKHWYAGLLSMAIFI